MAEEEEDRQVAGVCVMMLMLCCAVLRRRRRIEIYLKEKTGAGEGVPWVVCVSIRYYSNSHHIRMSLWLPSLTQILYTCR